MPAGCDLALSRNRPFMSASVPILLRTTIRPSLPSTNMTLSPGPTFNRRRTCDGKVICPFEVIFASTAAMGELLLLPYYNIKVRRVRLVRKLVTPSRLLPSKLPHDVLAETIDRAFAGERYQIDFAGLPRLGP